MSFRSRVAEHFSLVLSACMIFFAILELSYINDPDRFVGALGLVFGALTIVGLVLVPTKKDEP